MRFSWRPSASDSQAAMRSASTVANGEADSREGGNASTNLRARVEITECQCGRRKFECHHGARGTTRS